MGKNDKINIDWDQFRAMGNPENAPDMDEEDEKNDEKGIGKFQVRVHYERKGRGGKEAVIVRGIGMPDSYLSEVCKKIKSKLGVGGNAKDGEIVLQGNQREKIMVILKELGFKNVKPAGG